MNLSVTLQERSKVTDLLCHSISSTQRTKFSSGQALRTKHVKSLSAPPITQQGGLFKYKSVLFERQLLIFFYYCRCFIARNINTSCK